ncbi:hypothetical protein C5167_025286 [Papaver somniferum]|uniref:Glutathione peroxidase n=1 Tax=Papaver somniferum TaxID=3469 RepID=A0A4Y7JU11_PAPSO|nr:probable glutathione peroxidase 2 [Papaver somniferum]RZC63532.1 hypothetical protein C5167_025286 [Papaver somniferum]
MNNTISLSNLFSILILGLSLYLFFFLKQNQSTTTSPSFQNMAAEAPKSIYDFTVKDIHDADVCLKDYAGKVLLIVNVASKCGLTESNYKELNELYEKYKTQGFEILAFPCNQFAGQEPGTHDEIKEVACSKFKAEFPVFAKIDVNGKDAAPLYQYLKSQKGGLFGNAIKWNFTKFLVNKEGKVVDRYAPTTGPLRIEKDIQGLLAVSASAP